MNKQHKFRVLNTRPQHQAADLSRLLKQQGMQVIELPMLVITPVKDWDTKLPALTHCQQAIFVSPNAVSYFFNKIPTTTWPRALQTIAIGNGTANALINNHVHVDAIPDEFNSQGVLALPSLQQINHQIILLIKGIGGLSSIATTLKKRGARVIELCVYQRNTPNFDLKQRDVLLQQDAIDIIFISSQEALNNLFNLFGTEKRGWLCNKPFIVLSPRLAKVATDYGIKTVITTRYDTLLNTLEAYTHDQ
jgi:uroporphyrinogen-III synthase